MLYRWFHSVLVFFQENRVVDNVERFFQIEKEYGIYLAVI